MITIITLMIIHVCVYAYIYIYIYTHYLYYCCHFTEPAWPGCALSPAGRARPSGSHAAES